MSSNTNRNARRNISATSRGGLRTGSRDIEVAPVKVIVMPGYSVPAATKKEPKLVAYQDGPDFYEHALGSRVASYPSMVRNDFDMPGAERARREFLRTHPRYRMATDREMGFAPEKVAA